MGGERWYTIGQQWSYAFVACLVHVAEAFYCTLSEAAGGGGVEVRFHNARRQAPEEGGGLLR